MEFVRALDLVLILTSFAVEQTGGSALYTADRSPANRCCKDCSQEEAYFGYDETKCHVCVWNQTQCGACIQFPQGPLFWQSISPAWIQCGGSKQSPVNIASQTSQYLPSLGLFKIYNLCTRVPGKIRNDGHLPHLDVDSEASRTRVVLSNVPFRPETKFIFNNIHIHLGRSFQIGSEHSLDGNFSPMEIHMVFYDAKHHNIQAAQNKTGGLVVIGIFVEVADVWDVKDGFQTEKQDQFCDMSGSQTKSTCVCLNDDYRGMMCKIYGSCKCQNDNSCPGRSKCRRIGYSDSNCYYCGHPKVCRVRFAKKLSFLMKKYYDLVRFPTHRAWSRDDMRYFRIKEGITPSDVLPYNLNYYTYAGSLTTPPCFETVQWIILRCPIKVSRQAYQALAMVKDSNDEDLMKFGVDRPIQRGQPGNPPVNVYRNFPWEESGTETHICNKSY